MQAGNDYRLVTARDAARSATRIHDLFEGRDAGLSKPHGHSVSVPDIRMQRRAAIPSECCAELLLIPETDCKLIWLPVSGQLNALSASVLFFAVHLQVVGHRYISRASCWLCDLEALLR